MTSMPTMSVWELSTTTLLVLLKVLTEEKKPLELSRLILAPEYDLLWQLGSAA